MTASASRGWPVTTAGSRLQNAGFLGGDLLDRLAEKVAVIERHPGDDARQRAFDDIGGVEPAAEPDFEQQYVCGVAREQQKRRGGLDLEHRDRRVAVLALAFGERRGKLGIADKLAAALWPMRNRSLRRTRLGEV